MLNANANRKFVNFEGKEYDSKSTERWIAAKDLKIGDKVLLSNGKTGTITKQDIEILETPETTYNFEVKDFHTYYVGEQGILVHNACPTNDFPPNNGAIPGTESTIELQPGQYSRYGDIGPKSNFMTQSGASSSQLSLPPWNNGVLTEITVLKPIPGVVQSTIAPWAPWNGIGGGIQYMLPRPIATLKTLGYLIY